MASKKSLEAAAATSGMFTAATETEQAKKPKKGTRQQAKEQATSKPEMVVFSCRLDKDTAARWKAYASVDGYGDKSKLTDAALKEYMENHPLSKEQKAKYNALYEANKL